MYIRLYTYIYLPLTPTRRRAARAAARGARRRDARARAARTSAERAAALATLASRPWEWLLHGAGRGAGHAAVGVARDGRGRGGGARACRRVRDSQGARRP